MSNLADIYFCIVQTDHMTMPADSRYEPVKPVSHGGFVMLRKKDPKWTAEELVVMSAGWCDRLLLLLLLNND